jgi:hypothetical protein
VSYEGSDGIYLVYSVLYCGIYVEGLNKTEKPETGQSPMLDWNWEILKFEAGDPHPYTATLGSKVRRDLQPT